MAKASGIIGVVSIEFSPVPRDTAAILIELTLIQFVSVRIVSNLLEFFFLHLTICGNS